MSQLSSSVLHSSHLVFFNVESVQLRRLLLAAAGRSSGCSAGFLLCCQGALCSFILKQTFVKLQQDQLVGVSSLSETLVLLMNHDFIAEHFRYLA